MKSTSYRRPRTVKDLREDGRVILAHGEVTGHHHEVLAGRITGLLDSAGHSEYASDTDIPSAEFFEEPSGRRVLLVARPCVLTHQEHGAIEIDPAHPTQIRQGDVLLNPIGPGAWEVVRQREYTPDIIRNVAD